MPPHHTEVLTLPSALTAVSGAGVSAQPGVWGWIFTMFTSLAASSPHYCSSNSSLCLSYKKPVLGKSLLPSLAEVFSIHCPLWVFRAAQYFRVSLLLFAISCCSSLSLFLLLQTMYPSLCAPKPDRSVPVNLW